MITESLLNQINIGRLGKNQGYSMGLPKLESIIDGVTQQNYTLIFSSSGCGKTTLALFSYIFQPIKEHLYDGKFRVIYYSLEMSAEMLFAKLLSMYIFETYGIELSVKELLSRRRNYSLCDEYYEYVQKSLPFLEALEDIITVFDKGLDSDILYSSLMKEMEKYGKFEEQGNRKVYVPDDPDVITLVVIDHLSLVRAKNGRNLKQEMDLISSYLVTFRNRCKISPLVIMQANRESSSIDRRKEGLSNLTINDCKDSGAPAQDSEVIISIFNPFREKLNTYRGYDIRQLESNFRVITVLKNRYGQSDVEDCCAFYGKCGLFAEIPKPDEIYDYGKYQNSDWLLNKLDEEKELDNSINPTNFIL